MKTSILLLLGVTIIQICGSLTLGCTLIGGFYKVYDVVIHPERHFSFEYKQTIQGQKITKSTLRTNFPLNRPNSNCNCCNQWNQWNQETSNLSRIASDGCNNRSELNVQFDVEDNSQLFQENECCTDEIQQVSNAGK